MLTMIAVLPILYMSILTKVSLFNLKLNVAHMSVSYKDNLRMLAVNI